MISKPLDAIDKADILALIENEVRENRTIEYKDKLPGNSDADKKELLADICSFANASGGDILYGIEEKRGDDGKHAGIPGKATGLARLNVDEEIRRLDALARDGIEPRVPGVHMRAVEGFADGPVLVVRVPKSWVSPHMVSFKRSSRFFTRDNAGKHQLEVSEIRSAFALSEALPEWIRRFRDDRIAKIVADETPVPLEPSPKIVLHVMPVAAFSSRFQVDLTAVYAQREMVRPIQAASNRSRFNLDGFITWSWNNLPKGRDYCQVFRSGIIEAVDADLLEQWRGRKVIPSVTFEQCVLSSLKGYIDLQRMLDVPPPIVIALALLGVAGYELAVARRNYDPTPIDRDLLLLPDVLLEDYGADVATTVRPIFDAVWNAGGYERSENYDENGHWKP
jgi:hypothetical protein